MMESPPSRSSVLSALSNLRRRPLAYVACGLLLALRVQVIAVTKLFLPETLILAFKVFSQTSACALMHPPIAGINRQWFSLPHLGAKKRGAANCRPLLMMIKSHSSRLSGVVFR